MNKQVIKDEQDFNQWGELAIKGDDNKYPIEDKPLEYPCIVIWNYPTDGHDLNYLDYEFAYISEFMDVDLKCFTGGPTFVFTPVPIGPADHP